MLDYKKVKLRNSLVLIEEHELIVRDSINGVMLAPERIEKEKQMRSIRTGVVMLGQDDIEPGETVMYRAEYAEPIDIPIDGVKRPVFISVHNLIGSIDE